jgi:hypothetical protein
MKLKKTFKQIFALGIGASMVGVTLLSASAADLSEYPSMFIKNGHFDGVLAIGKNSNAIDTLAITNIALGLQAAAVTETRVCDDSSLLSSLSDGIKIVGAGEDFDVWKSIGELMPILDSSDLPSLLSDGTYKDNAGDNKETTDYTQVINFPAQDLFNTGGAGSGYFKMTQDEDGAPAAGPYLIFPEDNQAYEYVLEFDNPIKFDDTDSTSVSDDLMSTSIMMQGQAYTINGVHSTSGIIDKLTMMVGDTTSYMAQGQTITKNVDGTEHSIKMVDVTEEADSCGFEVDGNSVWISIGDTETFDGLTIGVIDAKATHAELQDGDICKVNFGASEITLEDGNNVKIDGVDVDGSNVALDISGAAVSGEWDGIKITWAPEENIYRSPNQEIAPNELIDPVFGRFKIVFAKEVRTNDDVMLTTDKNKGAMTFKSNDGMDISIPLFAIDDNSIVLGLDSVAIGTKDDPGKRYYYNSTAFDYSSCEPVSGNVDDCEGGKWIVEINGEAHILELENIDLVHSTIDFYDETYMVDDIDNDLDDIAYGAINNISISGLGVIGVRINSTIITLSGIGSADSVETEGGATLTIVEGDHSEDNIHSLTFKWTEDPSLFASTTFPLLDILYPGFGLGSVPGIQTETVSFPFSVNDDEEIEIGTPTGSFLSLGCGTGAWNDYSVNMTDIQVTSTFRGSGIGHNAVDKNLAAFMHPHDIVKADMYITPVDTAINPAEDGNDCKTYQTLNKIPSSVNKFDSDITDANAQDIISVGGPCANSVSSSLLGNPSLCYNGYEEGKVFLSLVESGDKVALVVAGASGKDTLAASKVLQDHNLYASKLRGKEMTIITTDPNNLMFEEGLKKKITVQPAVSAETQPAVVQPVAPVEPKITCVGTTSETQQFITESSKLGIKKELPAEVDVEMDGLNGKITFPRTAPFKPEYGVDWYQFIVHIMKGDANGPEVASLTFKWVEGEGSKTMEFTVPEKGCYALKMETKDLSIDGAKIIIKSNNGVMTEDFSTE